MKHEQITLYKIWDSIYDIGNEDLRKIMDSIDQRPSIDMRFDMLIQKLSRVNPILGNLVKLSREKRIPLYAFYQIFTNGKMLNVENVQTDVDPNVSYLLPAKLDAIMESIINIATKYDTPELQSIITNLKWFYKNPINGTLQCKYEIFNIIANNSHITMYIDGTVKFPKNGNVLGITWGRSNGFETLKIPMDTKKKYHITTDELSDIIRLFATVV